MIFLVVDEEEIEHRRTKVETGPEDPGEQMRGRMEERDTDYGSLL